MIKYYFVDEYEYDTSKSKFETIFFDLYNKYKESKDIAVYKYIDYSLLPKLTNNIFINARNILFYDIPIEYF